MMYSVGLFYAWDFLGWILISLAYKYSPAMILREKHEYVSFFLWFMSLAFTLFVVLMNVTCNRELTHMFFWVSVFPLLFLFHLFYPFRQVKRNQHLSFFLFFIGAFMLGVRGLTLLAYLFSTM